MQKIESKFTVFFDDPFWTGVYERIYEGRLEACKITFGAEPKDYEVYIFLLRNWNELRFSPPVKADSTVRVKINPKRMQRAIKKQLETPGVGTKSQEALKRQHEENKIEYKQNKRLRKEDEKQRKFELHKKRQTEKHRGR